MTTLRRFTCDDLFTFNPVNLDFFTETVRRKPDISQCQWPCGASCVHRCETHSPSKHLANTAEPAPPLNVARDGMSVGRRRRIPTAHIDAFGLETVLQFAGSLPAPHGRTISESAHGQCHRYLTYIASVLLMQYNLQYLAKWPEYCLVAEGPGSQCMGYILGKAEGTGEGWHGHVTAVTVAPEFR